jgi:Dienelactone hydrolase and related enzymes
MELIIPAKFGLKLNDKDNNKIHAEISLPKDEKNPVNLVILCPGAGGGPGLGGMHGPCSIYVRLSEELIKNEIATLKISYRYDADLQHSIDDLESAISYMKEKYKISQVILVGWSMGAGTVIRTACKYQDEKLVTGVITLAGQIKKILSIKKLAVPWLMIHGENDKDIPLDSVDKIYKEAICEKNQIILKSGHNVEGSYDHIVKYIKSLLLNS